MKNQSRKYNNIKVSVIMPVYNAEKTVSRMIDSIIAQTFTDWELICVDDGSTDATPAILDAYAQKFRSIKVIHKQNEGVAMARQTGVDAAVGEYSIHADADDWMDNTMLEVLYNIAKEEDADLVMCDYYQNYSNGKQELIEQHPTRLNTPDQIYDLLCRGIFSALWNKLIRHSLYKDYNIRFFLGANYCEDMLVCVQLFRNNHLKTIHTQKAYYHYMINDGSLTHNITRTTYTEYLRFADILGMFLAEDKYSNVIAHSKLTAFRIGFTAGVLSRNEIRKQFAEIRNIAYNEKILRWKLGYRLISFGLYKTARYLLKY